jgi:hypothetical protein
VTFRNTPNQRGVPLIRGLLSFILLSWGVTLLASVDISTRAPWITQNEQRFVAGEIPHELDA